MRKHKGDDRLEITLAEVISDVTHAMDFDAARLEKDGVEADLQVALAAAPDCCGEGFRLVRREWPTDIGPGRPHVPRRGRRLDRRGDQARRDDRRRGAACAATSSGSASIPPMAACRGVLAATVVKPQARVLAEARGLAWVEVDLAVLRGEREPLAHPFRLSWCACGARGARRRPSPRAGARAGGWRSWPARCR